MGLESIQFSEGSRRRIMWVLLDCGCCFDCICGRWEEARLWLRRRCFRKPRFGKSCFDPNRVLEGLALQGDLEGLASQGALEGLESRGALEGLVLKATLARFVTKGQGAREFSD